MKKDKKEKIQEIKKEEYSYFLFARHSSDETWLFYDEYLTKEECEVAMEQSGEPEDIKYMVIKGSLLRYEDAPARFPYYILEE